MSGPGSSPQAPSSGSFPPWPQFSGTRVAPPGFSGIPPPGVTPPPGGVSVPPFAAPMESAGSPPGRPGLVPNNPSDISKRAPPGLSHEIPQGLPSGMSQLLTQSMPPGIRPGMPAGLAPSISQGQQPAPHSTIPKDMPSSMSESKPSGLRAGMPPDMPPDMSSALPPGLIKGMPPQMPQSFSQFMPPGMPGMPSGMGGPGMGSLPSFPGLLGMAPGMGQQFSMPQNPQTDPNHSSPGSGQHIPPQGSGQTGAQPPVGMIPPSMMQLLQSLPSMPTIPGLPPGMPQGMPGMPQGMPQGIPGMPQGMPGMQGMPMWPPGMQLPPGETPWMMGSPDPNKPGSIPSPTQHVGSNPQGMPGVPNGQMMMPQMAMASMMSMMPSMMMSPQSNPLLMAPGMIPGGDRGDGRRRRRRRRRGEETLYSENQSPMMLNPAEMSGTMSHRRRLRPRKKQRVRYQPEVLPQSPPPPMVSAITIDSILGQIDIPEWSESIAEYYIGGDTEQVACAKALWDLIEETANKERPDEKSQISRRYFVKWFGFSHLHDTWDPVDVLQQFAGYEKVGRFISDWKSLPPKTQLARTREAQHNVQEWSVLRRIVDMRAENDEMELLCLWQGLDYDDATWESTTKLEQVPNFQEVLDDFRKRCARPATTRFTSEMREELFEKFSPIKDISWIDRIDPALELRSYQVEGVNFLLESWLKDVNVILADEMGLGKTVQSVVMLAALRHFYNCPGPHVVIVPVSTIPVWTDEFHRWAPDMQLLTYTSKKPARDTLRRLEHLTPERALAMQNSAAAKHFGIDKVEPGAKFDVLLTTFDFFRKDSVELAQIPWQFVVVDEAHRAKNHESHNFKKLMTLESCNRLLLTCAPFQNELRDLFNLLQLLNPSKFSSWEEFCVQHKIDPLRLVQQDLARLRLALNPFILRRDSSECPLPDRHDHILSVPFTSEQKAIYSAIVQRHAGDLKRFARPKLVGFLSALRNVCNHGFMCSKYSSQSLDPSEVPPIEDLMKFSGKLVLLDQLLTKLRANNHRVLVFSQMVRMISILQLFMKHRGFPYQVLVGSTKHQERAAAIQKFQEDDADNFCFLISTRAGGVGINLQAADVVILFDSDWNPLADIQALSRAHRFGQKKLVTVYRLVSRGSVEEQVLCRTLMKMDQPDGHLIQQRDSDQFDDQELLDILRLGCAACIQPADSIDLDTIISESTDAEPKDLLARSQMLLTENNIGHISFNDVLVSLTEHGYFDVVEQSTTNRILKAVMKYPSISRIDDISRLLVDAPVENLFDAVSSLLYAAQSTIGSRDVVESDLVISAKWRGHEYSASELVRRAIFFDNLQRLIQINPQQDVANLPDLSVYAIPPSKTLPSWSLSNDAKLLHGIFLHGFDNWETIISDDRCYLSEYHSNIDESKIELLVNRAMEVLGRISAPRRRLGGPGDGSLGSTGTKRSRTRR